MERVRKKGGGSAEDAIQRAVFSHIKVRGAPGVFAFHPKNGGVHQRGRRSGINVGLGVIPGVPDVIAIKSGQAFALELKTDKGETTGEQDNAIARLTAAGAICGVAKGLDAALRWLEEMGILKGRTA